MSGVYYPVDVLPTWMQWLAKISPATYALEAARAAILDGQGLSTMWDEIWPLLDHRRRLDPLGLWIFSWGERYAKKHGKLKRVRGCENGKRSGREAAAFGTCAIRIRARGS